MGSFLGVMGVTKRLETEDFLKTGCFDPGYRLMAGVLVNEDVLKGKTPYLKNRFPSNLQSIPEIFCYDERVANVIKFYWDNERLANKLFQLLEAIKKDTLDAIILPSWPPLEELLEFKSEYPDIRIILSITREKQDYEEDYRQLTEELEGYVETEMIEEVFLECNYYNTREVNPLYTSECLRYLETNYPNLPVGLEGVHSTKEMSKIRPLLKRFPDTGVIMEEGLRTSEDFLDLNVTKKYIQMIMAH
jgi:hypothetical protein